MLNIMGLGLLKYGSLVDSGLTHISADQRNCMIYNSLPCDYHTSRRDPRYRCLAPELFER